MKNKPPCKAYFGGKKKEKSSNLRDDGVSVVGEKVEEQVLLARHGVSDGALPRGCDCGAVGRRREQGCVRSASACNSAG